MPMHRYAVCGVVVESNVPLPELPPAHGSEPSLSFHLARDMADAPAADPQWSYRCTHPNGAVWLSVATHPPGYLLRFTDLADFTVSADGAHICCRLLAETPVDSIRHLLLDQVIPRAMTRRGRLVLHASAVALGAAAVAFLGRTGAGKSTLTAMFAVEGRPIVTDDCLTLDDDDDGKRVLAVPSYPGVRLWPDTLSAVAGPDTDGPRVAHYTPKRRMAFADRAPFPETPLPLARAYLLEAGAHDGGDPVRLEPLPRQAAVRELVKHVYRLDITDPRALEDEFERVNRLVAAVPVARLRFARGFEHLSEVRKAIQADTNS